MSDNVKDFAYRYNYPGQLIVEIRKYSLADKAGFEELLSNVFWKIGCHIYLSKESPRDTIDDEQRHNLKKCLEKNKELKSLVKKETIHYLCENSSFIENLLRDDRRLYFYKGLEKFKKE